MRKTIQRFSVEYLQILNEHGEVDKKLLPDLSEKQIRFLYEGMVLMRAFDVKAYSLQRQGRLLTFAPLLGQEAPQAAVVLASDQQDMIFPSFRENGIYILRGVPIEQLYQYWGGDERGMKLPKEANIFPICITVGEQPLHAAGYAWALKLRKEKRVAITFFGDGATSEGDFHEAMNFAGTLALPLVFICQNNQWAISVPVKKQTGSETLAQKAVAYGFKGIKVDGNDAFAMYVAIKEAVANARKNIPTFIEAFTFRMSDHTTADDATVYRPKQLVEEWKKKDPIARLQTYMKKMKMWAQDYEEDLQRRVAKRIEDAVRAYETTPAQDPADMFKYTYQNLSQDLQAQLDEFTRNKEQPHA